MNKEKDGIKCSFVSKDQIKQIIQLTAHENDDGQVWGDDIPNGTMEELINEAIEIIKNEKS